MVGIVISVTIVVTGAPRGEKNHQRERTDDCHQLAWLVHKDLQQTFESQQCACQPIVHEPEPFHVSLNEDKCLAPDTEVAITTTLLIRIRLHILLGMDVKLDEALAVLERTPATLRTLLNEIPNAWVHGTEGEKSWSAYQIVGHLIHGEKTDWIPRTRMILEHGESKSFEPFDRFFMLKLPQDRPLKEMLAEFEELRKQNIKVLKSLKLKSSDLEKKGMHPELGSVTLSQLMATWVVHDLGHLAQLTRVMSKQYTEAVGPWREYLPVLDTKLK